MSSMILNIIAAYVYFDLPSEEEIEELATNYVAQGADDSDALIDLAYNDPDPGIEEIIRQTFRKLSVPFPTAEQAGKALISYYAKKITNGELDPYEGARKIGYCIFLEDCDLQERNVFSALASEYEDFSEAGQIEFYGEQECARKRQEIRNVILDSAKKLSVE